MTRELLCIWWNQPNETITGACCWLHLIRLSRILKKKQPLHKHDQAKPSEIDSMGSTPDKAPSDYHLFRLMEYGLHQKMNRLSPKDSIAARKMGEIGIQ